MLCEDSPPYRSRPRGRVKSLVAEGDELCTRVSAGTSETLLACGMGVIFPVVIPWRYVRHSYIAAPGDRWR